MSIIPADKNEASRIASIVSRSNKDVARQFGLNRDNAPKHPSFCTEKWVLSDFERGELYFLFNENSKAKGCVAFEQADVETAYLNRLSVLPQFRHQGIGAALVHHILNHSRARGISRVSIGIIAENRVLKKWYRSLGFAETRAMRFDHLPFEVQYMDYSL